MEVIVPTFYLHIISISGHSCMRDCWDILVEMFHDGAHVIQVILVGLNDAKWYLHGRVKLVIMHGKLGMKHVLGRGAST